MVDTYPKPRSHLRWQQKPKRKSQIRTPNENSKSYPKCNDIKERKKDTTINKESDQGEGSNH